MTTVSLGEAQANLTELIHRLAPGGEVVVTENGRAVARIVATNGSSSKPGPIQGRVRFPLHRSQQPGSLSMESVHRAEDQTIGDEDASHAGTL